MPNWNTATYVFASEDKKAIEDFQVKLKNWLKKPTLCPDAFEDNPAWLGNILLRAGFGSPDDSDNIAPCRYRGTLDYVSEKVEEGIMGGHNLYFFYVFINNSFRATSCWNNCNYFFIHKSFTHYFTTIYF